ncbi:MAG: DUF3383 domain-containing protein [Elusimicrobiota bacterium]|jgi:hypothetical protein|nr:DUF3383 domain-containing protein [Elusimicrobiota bacterium]
MSNVSASKFVNVIPQLIAAKGSGFELNGLLLTKDDSLPLKQVFRFESASMVAKYFGAQSDEADFAKKYFAGYDGKAKIPSALLISNFELETQAGWLRGGAISYTLAQLQLITSGVLNVKIAGQSLQLEGLDFSEDNSLSDIAATLQTAIQTANEQIDAIHTATVNFSSQFNAFQIVAGGSDETSYLDFSSASSGAGTDLAPILALTQETGAVLSPVQSAQITLSAFMDAIIQETQNFISFAKLWDYNEAEDLAFASWASSKGVRFVYVEHDMEFADKDGFSESDFASKIKANTINATAANYGKYALAAFVMGAVASINFSLPNGKITLAYKQQSGQEITCDNDDDYDILTRKGYNLYERDSAASNLFTGYQRGVISGDYGFLDAFVNHVWLNDGLQVALRNLLATTNFIPYNDGGLAAISNTIKPIVDNAKLAGVITEGVDLSEDIINAVASETGIADIKNTLYTQGWYLYAKNPNSAARADRQSPILRFYYCDGGSIQKIDLISTAIR